MSYMFLIPLLGGTIFFILLGIIVPKVKFSSRYRFFYNLYNSGIALLTVGSLYTGILEIAGTNSSFSMIFRISAMTFIFLALLVFVSIIITRFAKLQQHLS